MARGALGAPRLARVEDVVAYPAGQTSSQGLGEGLGSGQGLGELSAWHAAHAAHSGLPASRMSSHTPAGQTSSQGLGEGLGSGEGEDDREMGHCAQPASWSFTELYSAPAG